MDKPFLSKRKSTLFYKVLMYYNIQTCLSQKFITSYELSQCALHCSILKFCKIVLWYECTKLGWMYHLLQLFLHQLPLRDVSSYVTSPNEILLSTQLGYLVQLEPIERHALPLASQASLYISHLDLAIVEVAHFYQVPFSTITLSYWVSHQAKKSLGQQLYEV